MTIRREIARSLVGGIWRTSVVDEDTGGNGGGSTLGASIVRGPFSFTFATAGLNNGVAVYTPTVDEILLDAWIEVVTAWNGTTPLADMSQYTGSASPLGLWAQDLLPIDLTVVDSINYGGGPLNNNFQNLKNENLANAATRRVIGRFTTADPLLLVVSQDGTKGGAAVGGSAGSAKLYLITATPAPI